jgi:hypothetical protein
MTYCRRRYSSRSKVSLNCKRSISNFGFNSPPYKRKTSCSILTINNRTNVSPNSTTKNSKRNLPLMNFNINKRTLLRLKFKFKPGKRIIMWMISSYLWSIAKRNICILCRTSRFPRFMSCFTSAQ